ncbi:hypothetical protein ODZ84_20420 [Chryseobacterium fluminis]|uniref:hypothetical protein n=1 Tax=Chryseobacterium fluminis TaxID=2983606 RepID=UPI00224CF50B|nr:hypothetical protein [Chryseobacterium sp. MMS21-Ot14]UZT97515.1 hypothetical protein ODZ84_20420 [Chryseobacterium sp. MMS21-Ot14]
MKLENLNLVELNPKELHETEGGWIIPVVVGLALSAINNWGDIREGWHDGGTGHPRH